MIPDPAPPYELGTSGNLRDRVQRMLDRAAALGIQPQISQAIAEILDRLTEAPRQWGDLLRNYRHAHTVEYRGLHKNFRCIYSVHERIPIVFMTELTPLEGNPLYGENLDG
jgi:hypothetical protein